VVYKLFWAAFFERVIRVIGGVVVGGLIKWKKTNGIQRPSLELQIA